MYKILYIKRLTHVLGEKMINEITVSGYKSIKRSTIKLSRLNILIGENGAGKNNFLSLFRLINQIIDENLQKWIKLNGGAENILYYGRKVTKDIAIDITFDRDKYFVHLSHSRDTLIINKEILSYTYSDGNLYNLPSTIDGYESTIRKEALLSPNKIADKMLKNMREWKIYHFHDTSINSPIKTFNKINDLEYFTADGSNLTSFLYFLKNHHPKNYLLIEKSIQLVAPYFDKFKLEPDISNNEIIYLKWFSKGFDHQMSIDDFSDGTLRFICYATLLQQPKEFIPQTIIIDEPELGLHPKALGLLASMIKTVTKEKQVIISTQSVEFINYFELEDLIIVDRNKEDSKFKRLDHKDLVQWLDDYSLGELWNKNLLGGR